MPHWIVFHPAGTFEDEDSKRAFSKAITSIYSRPDNSFPAFYVVLNFIKTQPEDQWIGGQKAIEHDDKPFVRIQVSHIHIRMVEDHKVYKGMMERIQSAVKPFFQDKGYNFELHIAETERLLWTVNGQAPPEFKSEDEKVWRAENRVVYPDEMEEMREKHKL